MTTHDWIAQLQAERDKARDETLAFKTIAENLEAEVTRFQQALAQIQTIKKTDLWKLADAFQRWQRHTNAADQYVKWCDIEAVFAGLPAPRASDE